MAQLSGKHVAILATNGFEQSELLTPKQCLEAGGAEVDVISLNSGKIKGWNKTDWGDEVAVDKTLDEAKIDDYDALVLPGGALNPDTLRTAPEAVDFVRNFFESKRPLAAICHAPWLLAEAGLLEGRQITSYKSIKTDMINAGADWVDKPVAVDQGLITSRNPGDLDAFCRKVIEEIAEGKHTHREVA